MTADRRSEAAQDLEWANGLNRLSLKFGGFWNTSGNTGRRDHLFDLRMLFFFILVLVVAVIPQAMALFRVWGNLFLMTDNIMISFFFVVTELQTVSLWQNNEVLMTMMEWIKEDWMRRKTVDERQVMLRYGKLSRLITIGGFCIHCVMICSNHTPVTFGFVLRTLTNLTDTGDRPFVLQTVYPFDAYESPVYEIIVVSQFLICSIASAVYTIVGTVFAAIVLHLSAQLENLAMRMRIMADENDTDNFRVAFKANAEEHQRLIRFSKMIESTFSAILLEVVIGFMVLVCLQGYQLTVILKEEERSLVQMGFCLIYITDVLFLMFVYSVVGDILVTQSEEIQYAAYNSLWYNLNYRESAQLIPVLVRSQKPFTITVGKFAALTLPMFANVLKTTAGYISVLLAVQGQ